MRIGLLTFHRSINYGAFMQCFSLITRLKKDFPTCEIEVIDYSSKTALDGYSKILNSEKDKDLKKKLTLRNNNFISCQEKLPLSKWSIISDDFSEAAKYLNKSYDAVIVGSDAIWNWIVRGFPNLYFLKDYNGLKFSYAASAHGLNYQNMTGEQKEYIEEAFSGFKYIGVRDITTENMVHYIDPNFKVYHNCDPTIFLNLEDVPVNINLLKEKMIKQGVDFSKPLIGIMAGNAIGREIKKKYRDNVQLVSIYEPNRYADIFLYDLTPYEWAHVFSFFKLTLTHFFHGTLFSLINGVPVIPIEFVNDFSALNTTKIKDVMQRLDLTDWREEADYRSKSRKDKLLSRLGFKTDFELWNRVNIKIDRFLCEDYSEDIKRRISKEALSYQTFYDAIKSQINCTVL